jgi:hypothetical protein
MKTPKIVKQLVITGFAALGTPRCYGQSEIDPDHFDSPNTEPFSQPKTKEADPAEKGKMRFDGIECLGQSHRLSAIHLNAMELVFDSSPQVEHMPDGKTRRTEKLLLTRTSPQK